MQRARRSTGTGAAAGIMFFACLLSMSLAFQLSSNDVVRHVSVSQRGASRTATLHKDCHSTTRCWLTPALPDVDDDAGFTARNPLPSDEASLLETTKMVESRRTAPAIPLAVSALATAAASWMATTSVALAVSSDDVELAELPPPYVPAIFAVVLLGGVGWFTASLGNVMDEEASLGLQSGARAKKEMERSRSSYFKKK